MFDLIKKRGRPSTGEAKSSAQRKAEQRKRDKAAGYRVERLTQDEYDNLLLYRLGYRAASAASDPKKD